MISDVLSDAKTDIEHYLNEPTFSDVYSDARLREQLHDLMISMEKIRVQLDQPSCILALRNDFRSGEAICFFHNHPIAFYQ